MLTSSEHKGKEFIMASIASSPTWVEMNTIYGDNDTEIYAQNHTMTQGVLKAAPLPRNTIGNFFLHLLLASTFKQKDIFLKKRDVFACGWGFYSQPARPLVRAPCYTICTKVRISI